MNTQTLIFIACFIIGILLGEVTKLVFHEQISNFLDRRLNWIEKKFKKK